MVSKNGGWAGEFLEERREEASKNVNGGFWDRLEKEWDEMAKYKKAVLSCYPLTVEPPRIKDTLGPVIFVLCREVVLSSEVKNVQAL